MLNWKTEKRKVSEKKEHHDITKKIMKGWLLIDEYQRLHEVRRGIKQKMMELISTYED